MMRRKRYARSIVKSTPHRAALAACVWQSRMQCAFLPAKNVAYEFSRVGIGACSAFCCVTLPRFNPLGVEFRERGYAQLSSPNRSAIFSRCNDV